MTKKWNQKSKQTPVCCFTWHEYMKTLFLLYFWALNGHLCPEMNAIARITNHKSKEQNNENSISSRKLQKLQITNSRLSQK